jgi:hypothetical protein
LINSRKRIAVHFNPVTPLNFVPVRVFAISLFTGILYTECDAMWYDRLLLSSGCSLEKPYHDDGDGRFPQNIGSFLTH